MKVGISFGYHPGHLLDYVLRMSVRREREKREKEEEKKEEKEEGGREIVKVLSGQRQLWIKATELKRLD